jgi:hypothetical protein
VLQSLAHAALEFIGTTALKVVVLEYLFFESAATITALGSVALSLAHTALEVLMINSWLSPGHTMSSDFIAVGRCDFCESCFTSSLRPPHKAGPHTLITQGLMH